MKKKAWYVAGQALDILAEFCEYLFRFAKSLNEGKEAISRQIIDQLAVFEDALGRTSYIDVRLVASWRVSVCWSLHLAHSS